MQGENSLKMFVGGLSQSTTTGGLKAYFDSFGEVKAGSFILFI